MPIFSFPDDNLCKYKGILIKLGTCIDIKEIWLVPQGSTSVSYTNHYYSTCMDSDKNSYSVFYQNQILAIFAVH